jgi:pyruvate,orthophosphate dikinase
MKKEKKTPTAKARPAVTKVEKYVYFFGAGQSEGNADMRSLLGGKGANLAEMAGLGLPVPPGFTITTQACAQYYELGEKALHQLIDHQVMSGLRRLESVTGKTFGKGPNPLLVSVRSGAAASMPGMMDTVLNLGLNPDTVDAMIQKTGNARFVWDSYRRFIQMFGNVVMGIDHDLFEQELESVKKARGCKLDTELETDDLKEVVKLYTAMVKRVKKCDFPTDAMRQLVLGINAVFGSWNNSRAIKYRALNDIRGLLGTAVNVQAMVFGNSGPDSATGVAFTRDPSTGEHKYFYGEYLINAQGEDVVAGIRTPQQITLKGSRDWAKSRKITEAARKAQYPSLEETMPKVFKELDAIRAKLERHYRDMQDMEFTIDDGRLYMLQTRNGKRTAAAAVRIAMDLVTEGLIDEKTAVMRVVPGQLDQLLHPVFVKSAEAKASKITVGLPASPGSATGQIVFNAATAAEWAAKGKEVIICRIETSPEDIGGMNVSQGVLTARGGMTSHAAVVARGMGKCCISGCGELHINYDQKTITCGKSVLKEGDWISLNGSTGAVYAGKVETEDPKLTGPFAMIMKLADKYRTLGIRTNADTPRDTLKAVAFGAEGVGLCRTEHMFFQGDRIVSFRRMILVAETVKRLRAEIAQTPDPAERAKLEKQLKAPLKQYDQALGELLPLQRGDFEAMFRALKGRPCTIRLLDPPLHEFLPQKPDEQEKMAATMHTDVATIQSVVDSLHEANPMLGHRGCRLGISYPEVTEMQVRAICEAAVKVKGSQPEIMVPLVGNVKELVSQKKLINEVKAQVEKEHHTHLYIKIGTMIEVPRAAITADQIAKEADFFSFGTNDLTQMTCAFSRDDAGKFLGDYVATGFYDYDPFQVLDQEGVGRMIDLAIKYGRGVKPNLKIGVCGEHGGDPKTIAFCHDEHFTYVSCSPYRVPIARLAAAQAALTKR